MFTLIGPDGRELAFWENKDGSVICQHRDLSTCDSCAQLESIVSASGVHYYIPDPADRADFERFLQSLKDQAGD